MDCVAALLESWDRQARIIANLAALVDEEFAGAKPDPEGWPIAYHLNHIRDVRAYWLSRVAPEEAGELAPARWSPPEAWERPDMASLRQSLDASASAIARAMERLLAEGVEAIGGYDHPVLFLQHMVWHEGYHYGLIALAMRRAGREILEDWEEENVWGLWRTE